MTTTTETTIVRPRVLKPQHAAKVLGTNSQSIRVRMRKGSFQPQIGTACQMSGNRKRCTYEIFPERLAAYLGITVDDLFLRLGAENAQA